MRWAVTTRLAKSSKGPSWQPAGGVDITLVGQEDDAEALRNEGALRRPGSHRVAAEVIVEGEAPALAIRHKRHSSIVVGTSW